MGTYVCMRAKMVLVVDLAVVVHICCTGCILPRELRCLRNKMYGPVTRGNDGGALLEALRV